MKPYHHLSPEDRAVIFMLLDQRLSLRQIARKLGRSPSTISRELSRNQMNGNDYSPSMAGRAYKKRRTNSVKPLKLQPHTPLYARALAA